MLVVLKLPQYDAPHDGSEPGERTALRRGREVATLDSELGEAVQDAREQVQVDLRVDHREREMNVGGYYAFVVRSVRHNEYMLTLSYMAPHR